MIPQYHPPYNTGAKDWKYNNDYAEGDDLNTAQLAIRNGGCWWQSSYLIRPIWKALLIDEKANISGRNILQVFPVRIQMISSVINPKGRQGQQHLQNRRIFIFCCFSARHSVSPVPNGKLHKIRRAGCIEMGNGRHHARADSPNQFYPVFIKTLKTQFCFSLQLVMLTSAMHGEA